MGEITLIFIINFIGFYIGYKLIYELYSMYKHVYSKRKLDCSDIAYISMVSLYILGIIFIVFILSLFVYKT